MSELRLDVALVHRGLVPSRERAQEAIGAGMVLVNGRAAAKAARKVGEADLLEVTGDPIGYVGRGGLKLEGALDEFGLSPANLVCLDVGASTGGFTDCLLRRGALRVYAVDVGHGQLHPTLRQDPRVVVMEGTDIRLVDALPELPMLVAVDVSFISLTLVLPVVVRLAHSEAAIAVLIKPQFEAGPRALNKKGVVKDPRDHRASVAKVLAAANSLGLSAGEVIPAQITGTVGNQEFLTLLRRG